MRKTKCKVCKKVPGTVEHEQYQTVVTVLSDGRAGAFAGRVLVSEAESASGVLRVRSVVFHEPHALPPGMRFEPMEEKP